MKRIQVALDFAGVILPVTTNDDGQHIVPLKPIVEIFGMDWKNQYRRIQTPYYVRRLGVCMGRFAHTGQDREMVGIRLDRVSAYLNTINPEQVRAGGNKKGADFLEAKHQEWDDLIHEYEVAGGILSRNAQLQAQMHLSKIKTLLAVNREIRLTQTPGARKALSSVASDLAAELGLEFQPDMWDGTGKAA